MRRKLAAILRRLARWLERSAERSEYRRELRRHPATELVAVDTGERLWLIPRVDMTLGSVIGGN